MRILPFGLRGSGSGQNATFTGALKGGKPRRNELAQFRLGRLGAQLERHHRAGLLAERAVWDADQRR